MIWIHKENYFASPLLLIEFNKAFLNNINIENNIKINYYI